MEYLTHNESYWSCDIEADDLRNEATRIHCVCVENIQTSTRLEFFDSASLDTWLSEDDRILIGHNFLAYDAPVLNRLWGCRIKASKVIDTFILSQMYSPAMSGGHALEAWGERLGYEKGDHSDFSQFSKDMLEYCRRDVSLTKMTYLALAKRMKGEGFSERSCEIEHLAWNIIQNKQKVNGFPFDQEKADLLYAELRSREAELKEEIYRLWPPELKHVRTFARGRKSNGERTAGYLKHLGQYPKLEDNGDGSYNAYDYVEFDLGSPVQRIQKLLDLGWTPVNYTKKGSPKIDEDEMLAFAESSGIREAASLAKWCVVNARANMIRTWQNAINPKTGCIHGSLFLASTGRYRHSGPNTANIPGVRHDSNDQVLYGEAGTWAYECRSLWNAGGKGWKLVGIDGKGMQSRCLAHNIAAKVSPKLAKEFTEELLEGDIHRKNMARFGFPSKPASKKAFYTILMGGGEAKVAIDQVQFGWTPPSDLRTRVIEGIPGFAALINKLQTELAKTGRITLCDGMKLHVPSPHMVIPYLLQGDESRLMKQAMIYIDEEVRRAGLAKHVLKVGDIHDESQLRVREEVIDEFLELALPQFIRAGESFDYQILIEGDANVGDHWAETH